MQQLIINIPDEKPRFFKERINNLGFMETDKNVFGLSAKQEWLVKQELKKVKESPETLLDSETEQDKINWDAC